jgi:hypothetical protein
VSIRGLRSRIDRVSPPPPTVVPHCPRCNAWAEELETKLAEMAKFPAEIAEAEGIMARLRRRAEDAGDKCYSRPWPCPECGQARPAEPWDYWEMFRFATREELDRLDVLLTFITGRESTTYPLFQLVLG